MTFQLKDWEVLRDAFTVQAVQLGSHIHVQRSTTQVNKHSCLLPYSSGIQRNMKSSADSWQSKYLQEGCNKRRKGARENCVKDTASPTELHQQSLVRPHAEGPACCKAASKATGGLLSQKADYKGKQITILSQVPQMFLNVTLPKGPLQQQNLGDHPKHLAELSSAWHPAQSPQPGPATKELTSREDILFIKHSTGSAAPDCYSKGLVLQLLAIYAHCSFERTSYL